jgi:hypothetical protein
MRRLALTTAALLSLSACAAAPKRRPDGVRQELPASAAEAHEEIMRQQRALIEVTGGDAVAELAGKPRPPDCPRANTLADNICNLAEHICRLAERDPSDDHRVRCADARLRCKTARARVAGACKPPA